MIAFAMPGTPDPTVERVTHAQQEHTKTQQVHMLAVHVLRRRLPYQVVLPYRRVSVMPVSQVLTEVCAQFVMLVSIKTDWAAHNVPRVQLFQIPLLALLL